ncbi:MAG: class I SAM-dependent methyltransferase [Candidatus Aenigmarchaeota archaeon]|nr:class I SAM-dependent methyltransferase [Candidatus Aenigmarchaeota archaeon]
MSLNESNLRQLNQAQRKQVLMQWEHQQHDSFRTDFQITPYGDILEGFFVNKGVWNPAIVTARQHAAYLFYHNNLFMGKDAIDIGCGTGLMGVVMAKYGAQSVVMSDVSTLAVENARQNIRHFGLENIASAVEGDCFGGIEDQADCIIFNQPYFAGDPPEGDTISASMLAPPELIKRFLREAPNYLKPKGTIVMPSFGLAGDPNNPAVVGKDSC